MKSGKLDGNRESGSGEGPKVGSLGRALILGGLWVVCLEESRKGEKSKGWWNVMQGVSALDTGDEWGHSRAASHVAQCYLVCLKLGVNYVPYQN